MASNESTAIDDRIHLVPGRIMDDSHRVHDDLFVTARSPIAPMPPPLPRRRAPNATPPAVRMIEDCSDDDSATQIDHVPQPIVPQYAYPTPARLPSEPYHPSLDATARVEQFDPIPVPVWAARAAAPPPPGPLDKLETVRVESLPPPPLVDPPRDELRVVLKLALPFAGLAIVLMFIGGYVVHHGQRGHKREVPIVMTVSMPPAPAPAVTAIVDEAPPTVTSTGEPIGWRPKVVQPTFIAKPAVPAVAVDEAVIELDPMPVATRRPASTPAAKQSVTRVARSARPEPAAAPARAGRADPVVVAIARPVKPAKSAAKGSGAGTLTITSTPSALIYVDGRSTNEMTPKTLTLAPGSHKITLLENTSRKAKTQEVDVPAGGSARVAKTF